MMKLVSHFKGRYQRNSNWCRPYVSSKIENHMDKTFLFKKRKKKLYGIVPTYVACGYPANFGWIMANDGPISADGVLPVTAQHRECK
jgi:hypothetical protein